MNKHFKIILALKDFFSYYLITIFGSHFQLTFIIHSRNPKLEEGFVPIIPGNRFFEPIHDFIQSQN